MPGDIERRRVIYHYRHALETVAEETDLFPRRLFTVMFPLYQVNVRGHERRAENYEELEWFFMRAIGYAQVQSVRALQDFYGLDEQSVRYIVEVLKTIGHLTEAGNGHLTLTLLGQESLAAERRYEAYESRQVLYFDAFTCHPLPETHYGLKFLAPSELEDKDKALFSFDAWKPEVLDNLAKRPDKAKYNVPDEVRKLDELHVGLAYLPMHIIEAVYHHKEQTFRVFTNVRGQRDEFFKSLFEKHPRILAPLLEDKRAPQEVMGYGLTGIGLSKGSYRLEYAPTGEWRVKVPRNWIMSKRPDGALRLADLGEFILAVDYCVRVWSDDTGLRYQAACQKLLDKLEHTHGDPSPIRIQRHIDSVFNGLEVPVAEIASLLKMAQERKMGRALDRLESVLDGEESGRR
ncbi:MAG: hypothetical protein KJ077_38475 [Anaerolineae bacterium]|nr:hypothetical protein [Anaerolineae bacterium]